MKATHWKVTCTRPVGFSKASGRAPWSIPGKARDVYNGYHDEQTWIVTKASTARHHETVCTKWGLDIQVQACALVELSADDLIAEGEPVPLKDEWPILVEKYAEDWYGKDTA